MVKKKKQSAPARQFNHTFWNYAGGLFLIAMALMTFIALAGFNAFDWPAGGHLEEIANPLKALGSLIAFALVHFTFGLWGSFAFPVIMALYGVKVLSGYGKPLIPALKTIAWGLMIGWIIYLVSKYYRVPLPEYEWGLMAGGVSHLLIRFTGFTGGWIITIALFLVLLRLTFSAKVWMMLFALIAGLISKIAEAREKRKQQEVRQAKWQKYDKKAEHEKEAEPEEIEEEEEPVYKEPLFGFLRKKKTEPEEEIIKKPAIPEPKPASVKAKPADMQEEYIFPSTDCLIQQEQAEDISDEDLRKAATSLEERLREFDVEAQVVGIHPGPVITRFDLQPAPGVKVSRIVALQDDLSLSMRARSLRILAPIPGESAVGIEIPNEAAKVVRLRTVVESDAYEKSKSLLTLALGVDTSGNPVTADLQAMPHLLVAGTTGSGKSVCLNSILASILFRAKPDEVRLALIDPKKLELSLYVPLLEHHLITPPGVKEPVITEPENALKMLKSLELEMQLRYTRLSQKGVRNLEEYNHNRDVSRLPYLVLIVDELADLMMTAGSAIESPIARLAQMGRAVGIHLILATQRPSVDVITGVIKANFPCRIAFQVASKVDSRTILDANGAESLLGKGDMLFLPPGLGIPKRIHGAMITGEEIESIVEHISGQPVSEERATLPDPMVEDHRVVTLDPTDKDELFDEAARLIAVHQQGSVSLLQRKLKIGYARAARLIDQMEMAGIVGPFDGSKARKVLVGEDWLPEMGGPGEGNGGGMGAEE